MKNTKPIIPFADWLKEQLKVTRMTQFELALEADMTSSQINRYCRGTEVPKLANVQRILSVFGQKLIVADNDN